MKYLGEGGVNLFQRIAVMVAEYKEKNGEENFINLGSGEPDTTPPIVLKKLVAEEIMTDTWATHTYQENNSKNKLNQNFIQLNTGVDIDEYEHISSQIIPGEKPMLGLLPITCGANREDVELDNEGYMVNAPSYDVIQTWSEYLGEESYVWPIFSYENFRLSLDNMPKGAKPRLIVVVKPGNPCPVGASREEWKEIIEYCIENNIRLVNDGAYTALTHTSHVSLTEVAKDYLDLEWIELFSMSKTYSACGWRLGVAVGSNDFVSELAKVKGNTDSGPFGPLISGFEKYLESEQSVRDAQEKQKMYAQRLQILRQIFIDFGLKPACDTDAGFFMLFKCPSFVNGEEIRNAEEFNQKVFNLTGIIGVPFSGVDVCGKKEQFIRYSACYDISDEGKLSKIKEVLERVKVRY